MRRRPSTAAAGGGITPRKRRRRLIESAIVIVGCALLADAVIGERGVVAMMRAREEFQQHKQELAEAQAEYARLVEEVNRLQHDPATIEDAARRELGLIKPGEKLFTIKDLPPTATAP